MKIARRTLSLAALLLPLFSLFAVEISVGTPVYGPARGPKSEAVTASDGEGFLVAWVDGRGPAALLATRVTAGGEVLDPLGIPIAFGGVQAPRIVWAGDAYVLIWQTSEGALNPAVMAARLDREGRVISGPRQIITGGWAVQGAFAASNGSRIVIGYTRPAEGYSEVRAAVVDANLDPVGDQLLAGPDVNRTHISIAASGGRFLAVWDAMRGPSGQIEAVRLDGNGAPIDERPRVISTGIEPELATDGSRFVLVVRVPVGASSLAQATRAIDLDWTRTDLRTLPEEGTLYPTVVWTGSRYVAVTFKGLGVVTATAVSADGTPLETKQIIEHATAGITPSQSAATNGSRLLVTWIESTPQNDARVVRAQLFDNNSLAPATGDLLLSNSANDQRVPDVAFDGTNYLVAWGEATGVYATRVSRSGVSLDGRGVQLSTVEATPRVAFDGSNFIVAWAEYPVAVVARFVGSDGVPGTEVRLPVALPSLSAIAVAETKTLLVWTDIADRVFGALLDRDAHTISAPVVFSPAGERGTVPTASWNGHEFLVAWADVEPLQADYVPIVFDHQPRIRGTRVTRSLSVRDPASLVLADHADADDLNPALASNGTDWLLAWENITEYGAHTVLARRIRLNGTSAEETTVSENAMTPAVRWDGARYTLAFRGLTERTPVIVAGVSSAAQLLGMRTVAWTDSQWYTLISRNLSLAAGDAVTYTRFSWAPQYGGANRVMLNFPVRKYRSAAARAAAFEDIN